MYIYVYLTKKNRLSVTTQSSKNRVHVFKGGLKVSSPLKSNLR